MLLPLALAATLNATAALPPERPHDPPSAAAPQATAAIPIHFNRFTSIQVNVNAAGANIANDAANEPSIVVDPSDHARMAIGWRQFDAISSDFREAGVAYSTDGGHTWTQGVVAPNVFYSDPVLAADADGNFFYLALGSDFRTRVFASANHGQTWGAGVFSSGGDKPWMTIDATPGAGRLYETWSTNANYFAPNTFARSLDDGDSFEAPSTIPHAPTLGTMTVGPDGTLWAVGTDTPGGPFVVTRSANASDPLATPGFTTTTIDLGGVFRSGPPNPIGLLSQPWIAVDRSDGPRHGWVYVLASVQPPNDPIDVHFVRSTDGGATWSAPVRVNDDPGNRAFQWFGMMSVAPGGRIDAAWNDTRGGTDSTKSALYYSYSNDGGATWSPSEQASPVWSSMLGFPKNSKIGDYDSMVSDDAGADIAYAATFTGGQDVYYLRAGPPVLAVGDADGRALSLRPASPNPFRGATSVAFDVPPGGTHVRVDVLDVTGRRIATLVDGDRAGGPQVARWDGRDGAGAAAAPGVYVIRLAAAGRVALRRVALLR